LKYELLEEFDGKDGNSFVVEELYADQAAIDAHFVTEPFQALGKAIAAEDLLAAPLVIKKLRTYGGYVSK